MPSLSIGESHDTAFTRRLLTCGTVAGPFFVVVGLIQSFTIPGFDLTKHFLSLLSAGEYGWIQIGNFVVSGLLTLAAAVGMWRALDRGRMRTAGPILIGAYGLGFAAAGMFVADPALGFPPGAPEGFPDQMSWHGMMHGVAAIGSFLVLVLGCFAFAIRFAGFKEWGWVVYSVATGVIAFAMPSIPNPWGGVFLFVASAIGWAWLFALSARLKRELTPRYGSIRDGR